MLRFPQKLITLQTERKLTNMKKATCIITALLLLTACGDSQKEAAMQLLEEARTILEQGDLATARTYIDSLRTAYPNVVEARKGALTLHQEVELRIAQQEMTRTDSLLQLANRELDSLQQAVDAHKKALKATPEELTLLTQTRIRRDSIRTQFETLGAKIRYIHQKQKE